MKWLIDVKYIIPLILFAGVAQYALVAVNMILFGEVSLWTLESDVLEGSGPLRYIKDIIVVLVAIAWVIFLPTLKLSSELVSLVKTYFFWLTSILIIGTIAFLLDYSPITFFPAGFRWLLLLHAAFGVFLISSALAVNKKAHVIIFRFICLLLALDTYAVFLQFVSASSLYDLAFGAARLPGLFSNAGVAAFFVIAITLICGQLEGISLNKRMAVTALCVLLALSSGTRFATMALFIFLLLQVLEKTHGSNLRVGGLIKILLVPTFVILIVFGYGALIDQVDRGNAISDQFGSGGRVANFIESIELLSDGDIGELLIGRGLGIGTNTAYSSIMSEGINPEIYRFNLLVDNAFLTCFFQIGLVGSLIFWYGLGKFIFLVRPKKSKIAKIRFAGIALVFFLTVVLGNPFEHFFLMMSYAIALSGIYWTDRLSTSTVSNI